MEPSLSTTMSDDDGTLESMKRRLFPEDREMTDSQSPLDEHSLLMDGDEDMQAMALADDDPRVTSPTSVAVVFGLYPDLTLKSTIVMGDEGAEVALHDLMNVAGATQDGNLLSDPSSTDAYAAARTSSLLDVERTPARKSPRMSPRMATNSFVCGGNDLLLGCDGDSHAFVERTIQTFLENSAPSPGSFHACTDWQAWSYFGFGGEYTESPAEPSPSKENIRSVLRSRTFQSLRARKSAVRQLRKDLAPFADSPSRSPAPAPALIRIRSFSVSDHRRTKNEKGTASQMFYSSARCQKTQHWIHQTLFVRIQVGCFTTKTLATTAILKTLLVDD
jgi:hypothetical protein